MQFCEYVVPENNGEEREREYVRLLLKEMKIYSEHIGKTSRGGNVYSIELSDRDRKLSARIKETDSNSEILSDIEIAFNHAK